MSNEPQEPEYICTKEDLGCLSDYIEAALRGDESKIRLRELFDQEFSVIRSRPHLISLLTQDTTDCPHHRSVFRNGFDNDAPMEHHCDFLNNICEVEEEKIRQDERTKVLDELILHYEKVIEEGKGVTYNHPIDYQWMYGGTINYLKSLRKKDGNNE